MCYPVTIMCPLSGQSPWQGTTITRQPTTHHRDPAVHQAGAVEAVLPKVAPLQAVVEWHEATPAVIW